MKSILRKVSNLLLSFAILASMLTPGFQPDSVSAQTQPQAGIQREYNAESGKVTLISGADDQPVSVLGPEAAALTPEAQSLALVQHFAKEFGLSDPVNELKLSKIEQPDAERVVSKYQQVYQGVPVMAGELIVNASKAGELISMNGEVSQGLSLDIQPELTVDAAIETAKQGMVKWYDGEAKDYTSTQSSLWIFDESLLRPSIRPANLVWRIEMVSAKAGAPIRELVLVDAKTGNISLHFNQVDTTWGADATNEIDLIKINTSSAKVEVPAVVDTTWYVTPTGNDANSCAVIDSPCLTINGAINKAALGDTIKVALGTYTGSGDEVVLINKSVTLLGGWNVVFTAQSGTSTIDGQTSRRGITVNSGITATIDHFVMKNGFSSVIYDGGGGISNKGTLTLNNSTVIENSVSGSWVNGGGIYNDSYSNMTISNSTIAGNIIDNGSGGGIYNNSFSNMTINNSTITGNIANGMVSSGGGIYNYGTLTLNNNAITWNTINGGSHGSGGAGIGNNGTMIVNNSSISSNTGNTSVGGGISNHFFGTMILSNTTVSNNMAFNGAGIYSYSTMDINSSTITANISADKLNGNGGVYNNSSGARLAIQNTIIANNIGKYPDCLGTIRTGGYNLIGNIGNDQNCRFTPTTGDKVGTNTSPINPRLAPLQDNGGTTLTHALMAGSPAIDAGSPTVTGTPNSNACPSEDQRGVTRPQGVRCDIGAYEYELYQSIPTRISTYDAAHTQILPGTLLCQNNNAECASSIPGASTAHAFAYGTDAMYLSRHSRHSIDNKGIELVSTIQYWTAYANAFWSGTQMVYGDAYGFPLADDVVAHELTHGVTQYESNLFYFYQSGAINESLSDVWGEYYDQTNGLGNDSGSVRWLMGEDVSRTTPMRNMSNPPAYSDPDKMSSNHYYEGDLDNGGVHTNSGVNNKAVFLMVDGGPFGGIRFFPIGWDKTAAIYYEAQTHLLSSGADYSDLYYVLQQACINLTGQLGITATDCHQVKSALDAVEMYAQPAVNFNPDAPVCASGYWAVPYFQDDMESGTGKWNMTGHWSLTSGYASSPAHMLYGDDYYASSDSAATMAAGVALPAASNIYLHFKHAFAFEFYQNEFYDGGVLEYSLDNGAYWADASPFFMDGKPYNGTIMNYNGTANALKGRTAFIADSHGYVSSRYNLTSLGGQNVKFRWRFATDNSYYYLGWMLDDVQIYTCEVIPAPVVNSIVRTDISPTGNIDVNFKVTFSQSVTGVDKSDFSLTTSGVLGATVSGVSGMGSLYTVSVNTGSGSGTIRLDIADNDSIANGLANPLGGTGSGNGNFTGGETYTITKTWIFGDVPSTYWAHSYIERLYNAGITGGCSTVPLYYCPANTVTRAQMAVFLLRGIHGSDYTPPSVGAGTGFADVPVDHPMAAWIKQLAAEGITGGCSNGNYCPDAVVTRAQMAVFLLRSKYTSAYTPPPADGDFTDVPLDHSMAAWIEQLALEGITGGCGAGTYCPDMNVTRDQMAIFLVRTFNLP